MMNFEYVHPLLSLKTTEHCSDTFRFPTIKIKIIMKWKWNAYFDDESAGIFADRLFNAHNVSITGQFFVLKVPLDLRLGIPIAQALEQYGTVRLVQKTRRLLEEWSEGHRAIYLSLLPVLNALRAKLPPEKSSQLFLYITPTAAHSLVAHLSSSCVQSVTKRRFVGLGYCVALLKIQRLQMQTREAKVHPIRQHCSYWCSLTVGCIAYNWSVYKMLLNSAIHFS